MKIVGRIEREDGSVYRVVFLKTNGADDAGFILIKPWSLEWIKFKISKWRFFHD